ncbi:elements of external origin [Oceanibaculum nanhaiense]|uniref:elements of external origin n=1 Tax=Oceanibaculum nanhaiense TaxID=1909734 RepID=UPI001FE85720|nr:elements of external origin [Oceanibaculum nanhaiense]
MMIGLAMQGMSERRYAAHVGLSRGAIQKAKAAGRLVLHADGSIDAAASDRRRAETTDPSKTRRAATPKLKPVPEAAVSAVGDTLREQGMAAPVTGGGTTFLQAKTAHEVLKAQERRIRLARLKGELVDRDRATALVFRLAREERDAWVNWPARVAALMAAELGTETAAMQKVLEAHVRAHLEELAQPRIAL